MLDFGMWENTVDLTSLNINRAQEEKIQASASNSQLEILPIDDHQIHIDEHSAYILGGAIKKKINYKEIRDRLISHIEEHKKFLKVEKITEKSENNEKN